MRCGAGGRAGERLDGHRRFQSGVLTVEDDGPGVAPERLVHIFERYYSHRPGPAPGAHLGIGLCLVSQHVLLLGGAIAAVNRAGGGLSVVVRLPIA